VKGQPWSPPTRQQAGATQKAASLLVTILSYLRVQGHLEACCTAPTLIG